MNAAAEKFMAPAPEKPGTAEWLAARPRGDGVPAWMQALRDTAAESFSATGLPTNAWEDWRHANLRGLAPGAFRFAAAGAGPENLPPPLLAGAARIVLVDGRYQAALSAPPPFLRVLSLRDAAAEGLEGLEEDIVNAGEFSAAPFRALNAAHLRDGIVLLAEAGRDAAVPVEVLFYATPGVAAYPRVLYRLGENAGLKIIERHAGAGESFTAGVADAVLAPAARLFFARFMDADPAARNFFHMTVRQEKASSFEGFVMTAGGLVARQDFRLHLLDSSIDGSISGIYMTKGRQNHDLAVLTDHFAPGGTSGQFFKGVVDDEGRAVFQGKIHVRRPAQGTDGKQSHHALLLSAKAEARVKPELEIYADDVKCSHGATAGQIDPAALFYLRSRGIPEDAARALLVEAFLDGAAEKISYAPVRDLCRARVAAWLSQRRAP